MRHYLLSAAVLFSGPFAAHASSDDNLGQAVWVEDTTDGPILNHTWWGTSGMNYLVRVSTDLSVWTFFPNYNPLGADAMLGVEIPLTTPRLFSRIHQFDPNDVSATGDSDGDGLPDLWELYHFGNLDRDGSGDWNEDGLLDRDAFRFGLNPKGDDESEVAGKFDVFSYDARGWLDGMTLTGNASVSFGLDDEGNIETAN